jgi:hypothetical protein
LPGKVENEESLKGEESSTASEESCQKAAFEKNYEKFESGFYERILEILNKFRGV